MVFLSELLVTGLIGLIFLVMLFMVLGLGAWVFIMVLDALRERGYLKKRRN